MATGAEHAWNSQQLSYSVDDEASSHVWNWLNLVQLGNVSVSSMKIHSWASRYQIGPSKIKNIKNTRTFGHLIRMQVFVMPVCSEAKPIFIASAVSGPGCERSL